jgi:predicted MFS family arabinose efflux permease
MTNPPPAAPLPVRSLTLLSVAAFMSGATLRVADPLLPQVAEEFGSTVGDASFLATGFTLAYGLCQIVYGPLGDRFGKLTVIAVSTLLAALGTAAAAGAQSLAWLGIFRLLSGAAAGGVIPLAFAFIGDVVPYERRQPVLARFLSGQLLGIIFGQASGGAIGDLFGWRGIFLLLGGGYFVIAVLLALERRRVGAGETRAAPAGGVLAAYLGVLRLPWVRVVVATVFAEGGLFFGGFAYLGAFLRHDFDLGYATMGALLGCFGLGALFYSLIAPALIRRLGERGLVLVGGFVASGCYVLFTVLPVWWAFVPAIATAGTGFYMMHNTLQTNGTQMVPHARGLGMSVFAACLFLGQAAGIWLGGVVVDGAGYRPMFLGVAALLLALAFYFRARLATRT